MGFKDHIAADNSAVFLNTAEFGELRSIDGGAPVATVLEDDERGEMRPSATTSGSTEFSDGVWISKSTLHVRVADVEARPAVGQRLTVDDRPATVVSVAEEMGILSIGLQWYES